MMQEASQSVTNVRDRNPAALPAAGAVKASHAARPAERRIGMAARMIGKILFPA
jgi:hypothetical protein